jgi:nicotinamide-nucleotide amidase
MDIEIICTGDEVLTGATVNTNFSHISQRLGEAGFTVKWGTTVGDDRETLLDAFQRAAGRADAVIVNGGLGPTVDDLSQEVAARAAGVSLVFDEVWHARMEEYFRRRARTMPPNNRKQAMLPEGSERLDNPVGTACGFALDIGGARFFFTPGVPRELHRMLDEQILPRLLARAGRPGVSVLKRFHSFGLGESRVDSMLSGLEAMVPDGSLKLGFRAHYPQLETKLLVRAASVEEARRTLAPVEAEVRLRLGNFILAEDDARLEAVVLDSLARRDATLAMVESFTGGGIAARLAPLPGAGARLRRALVTPDRAAVCTALALEDAAAPGSAFDQMLATVAARAAMQQGGTTLGMAVLIDLDEGPDRVEFGGNIHIAIVGPAQTAVRCARLLGGREWIRLGSIELGLDCLRRFLTGLPVDERIDFEKT